MIEAEYCECGEVMVTLPDGSRECPRCDKPRKVRK